jgi:hypothetical protein
MGETFFLKFRSEARNHCRLPEFARIAKNRRNCCDLSGSQLGELSLLALFGNRGSLGNFLRDMDPSPASRDRDFRKEQHLSMLPGIH